MKAGPRTAYLVYTGLLGVAFVAMIAGPVSSAPILSSASISATAPLYSGLGPYAVTLQANAGGDPARVDIGAGDIVCANVNYGCGPLNLSFGASGFGTLTNFLVLSLTGTYTHLGPGTISGLYPSEYAAGQNIGSTAGIFGSSAISGHISGVMAGAFSSSFGSSSFFSSFSAFLDLPFELDGLDDTAANIPISGFASTPMPGGFFLTNIDVSGTLTLDSMPGGGDLRLGNSIDVTFADSVPEPNSDVVLPVSTMILFYLRRRARGRMLRARNDGS